MADLPTDILPSSARKMLLGLRSLSKLKEKLHLGFLSSSSEFTSNYSNAVIINNY